MCASRATQIRISKEIKFIESENYRVVIEEDNVLLWHCTIIGPSNTPYEKGEFECNITFPVDYPFSAPSIKFNTKLYHPNISDTGEICLGIFKDWKAQYTIKQVLEGVLSLLIQPNSDDPLMPEIGNLYRTNKSRFLEIAKEWTKDYAKNDKKD